MSDSVSPLGRSLMAWGRQPQPNTKIMSPHREHATTVAFHEIRRYREGTWRCIVHLDKLQFGWIGVLTSCDEGTADEDGFAIQCPCHIVPIACTDWLRPLAHGS